jgi:hypothetical protein
MSPNCVVILIFSVCCFVNGAQAQQPDGFSRYRAYFQLRAPGHGTYTATDMNEHLQVVGAVLRSYNHQPIQNVAARWSAPRGLEIFDNFEDSVPQSYLYAINNHGLAVGGRSWRNNYGSYVQRPVALLPEGKYVTLDHPGTMEESSVAVDVNDEGAAIGYTSNERGGKLHAVRWNSDGTAEILPDAGPDVRSINSRGDIVGVLGNELSYLRESSGNTHFINIRAVWGSESNVVVGTIGYPRAEPVLWSPERGIEALPRPSTKMSCYPMHVNRHLQIVGSCSFLRPFTADENGAVIWQRIGGEWRWAKLGNLIDRGNLTYERESIAYRITDAGHILVQGSPKSDPMTRDKTMILVPLVD